MKIDGAKLRALRQAAGLSQRRLGAAVGRTSFAILHIEKGHYAPSEATVNALAGALGCSVTDLQQAADAHDGLPHEELGGHAKGGTR